MTEGPDEKPPIPAGAPRYPLAAVCVGILLVAIFSAQVAWLRSDLRSEIHLKIIERDAAVLYPMALQQVADSAEGGA